jgi:hypothetical protein
MNKNIILAALQSQLETIKADAIAHENDVYNPALAKLTSKIKVYFETHIFESIHDMSIASDRITVMPNDDTSYGNTITIDYRGGWRGDNGYFETSSYRPDLKSNEDNTNTVRYYKAMAAIAAGFDLICEQYKTKWLPAFTKIESVKSDKYSEIYKIEREIRSCESEIAELEKEKYNQAGIELTLKPTANYDSNYDNNECVYTKKYAEHHIRAQYGRSKYDYAYINSFKVVSFPKAKFGKVVLEWKGGADDTKTRTVELNKQRYAEFISEVHNWQTRGAAEREESIDERIARYNKLDA